MKSNGIAGDVGKASARRFLGAGVLLAVAALPVSAQMSAIARVQLVATKLPQAAFESATRPREVVPRGAVAEAVASVAISANTAYRLVVHRAISATEDGDATPARIWVQTRDGAFQQLTSEQPVVAYTHRGPDDGAQNQIRFRVERGGSDARGLEEVPIRYELELEPTL